MLGQAEHLSANSQFMLDENEQLVVRVRWTDVESEKARVAFMQTIEEQLTKLRPQVLVFDIAGLSVLPSSVVGAALRYRKNGLKLWFKNASVAVTEMLERTNLIQVIGIQRE